MKWGESDSGTDFFFKFPENLKMYLDTKEHLVASNQITKWTCHCAAGMSCRRNNKCLEFLSLGKGSGMGLETCPLSTSQYRISFAQSPCLYK